MKKLIVLFILLGLTFCFGNSYAQKIKFTALGGYSLPMGELKGDYPGDVGSNPQKLFEKNGFNFGGVVKYYVDKSNSIGLTLSGIYSGFMNTVDQPIEGISTIKIKTNFFQIGLGGEYVFPVKGNIKPYAGADITCAFVSGKINATPVGLSEFEETMKSTTRFGFNIGAGVEYKVAEQIGLNLGLKYQFYNLIGKKNDDTPGNNEYVLRDKEYTVDNTTWKSQNLMGLQIYGGVSLYLDKIFK